MTALSREDATEMPVGGVAVPKTVQKNALSREDSSEIPLGGVAVPKTGQNNALPRDNLYPMGPASRVREEHTPL